MSCSEVMYQYYPYIYQRPQPPPHPTHPHAAPHAHPHANPHAAHHSPARPAPFQPFAAATATHQYDRLNVHQRSLEAAGLEICGSSGSVPQGQPSSAGSVGSAPSPASPRPTPQPRPPLATTTTSQPSRTLDDDRSTDAVGAGTAAEDSDDGESRAEYLTANCVLITNYRGDAAAEVEEHFQRALTHDKLKENISPMSMRNFPPSFWNSQHPGDVYEYPTDPWHAHYPQYHHRAVHDYHHHNMAAAAAGYGGLLLGGARGLGHHTSHHTAHHAHAAASYKDWTAATPSQSLVDASSAPPYPHGPYAPLSGLESQVQDSKDLYWF